MAAQNTHFIHTHETEVLGYILGTLSAHKERSAVDTGNFSK